jgi:DNA-3-methyladenine glycosylase
MPGKPLRRAFFDRPTLVVAEELLGKVLVHRTRDGLASGMIVEVEAYIGEDDPACHAAPGPTKRNRPLYGPPGFSYVYLNYGMHYLTNFVTEPELAPAAVLVRALSPVDGVALMRRRRNRSAVTDADLCRGPGNLSRALGITLDQNGLDLEGDELYVEDRGIRIPKGIWSPRIGINVGTEQHWRCCAAGHPSVSGPRRGRNRQSGQSGEVENWKSK